MPAPVAVSSPAVPRLKVLPPLALYIHVPWCVRKCPYCDFNSHEARGAIPEAEFAQALILDLESALPQVWGRRVYSVFFGGGTPSLLAATTVDAILSAVRARLPLASDAEITLEANPGTAEAQKFRDFRAAGVNRLSLGIQSFDDARLRALGRIHDGNEARRAAELALTVFDNVNLDLMYGLPGQSVAGAVADLEAALAFAPPHLSAYHLTLEPNTLFHRHPPELPPDDETAEAEAAFRARLAESGYRHYETSAYAKPGRECRHNLNYWHFGDYLGIGPGAHGKVSFPDRIVREVRFKQPRQYLAAAARGDFVLESHAVAARDLPFEFLLNALRLTDGFETSLFEERTGLPIVRVGRELGEAEARGLVARDHRRIAPTELGQRFLNDLLQIFLPDAV